MFETVKYLIGSTGASGFGSKSTGEDVTAAAPELGSITAIITGWGNVGDRGGDGASAGDAGGEAGAAGEEPEGSGRDEGPDYGEFPGAEIIVLPLDLSSLSSVRCFVFRFLALNLPLNLLINNAGKFSYEHAVSEDGVEMTFATNYLGHFLLTKLLLNKMAETARETGIEGRIVNVSSSIHGWFFGDCLGYLDLMTRKKAPYDATRAYALSKLANVLHTRELTQRLEQMDGNVTANCVHPGIVRTRLTRDREGLVTDLAFFLASKLLKTIPQAAATTCYVATHPRLEGVSGKYFADCNEVSPSSSASSPHEAARLWHASEAMTAPRPDRTWFGPEPPLSSDKPHDEM